MASGTATGVNQLRLDPRRSVPYSGIKMPRYYFHIYSDDVTIDREGQELADFETARLEATRGARELICDSVRKGRLTLGHRVEVEDEDGRPLFTIRFADAVTLND